VDPTAVTLEAGTIAFVVCAAGVWWAGGALAVRADLIADRTGIGRVFLGSVVLGIATSLPEIATTVSAAANGAGSLAGNNLLGGVAMQIAVLAAVDMFALRGRALTSFEPSSSVLLHGVFLLLLLTIAGAAIIGPDVALGGRVSPWSLALAAVYGLALYSLVLHEREPRWVPRGEVARPPASAADLRGVLVAGYADTSLRRLVLEFAAYSFVVLAAGMGVAISGEAIAELTGLGQTLIGATLVAVATSLPEVSTTFNAVRIGAYSIAVGNILGTNTVEVALLLPADLFYGEGSIFAALDEASLMLTLLGAAVSLIYLWGVLERRDRTICNLGVDSALVLVTYLGGMVLFGTMS
jgi:cation:H+ antiporter